MKTFTYWNNENGWHAELMAQFESPSIHEADAHFSDMFGYHPKDNKFIGVTITSH